MKTRGPLPFIGRQVSLQAAQIRRSQAQISPPDVNHVRRKRQLWWGRTPLERSRRRGFGRNLRNALHFPREESTCASSVQLFSPAEGIRNGSVTIGGSRRPETPSIRANTLPTSGQACPARRNLPTSLRACRRPQRSRFRNRIDRLLARAGCTGRSASVRSGSPEIGCSGSTKMPSSRLWRSPSIWWIVAASNI